MNTYHRHQDAKLTPRPTGKHIGWVAQEAGPRRKRFFTMDATAAVRDMLWRNGENGYEWVRGLYYDAADGYQIQEVK